MADVVTNTGRAHIAGLLSNTVAEPTNYFGSQGTGAGTAAVADTTLFTEVGSRATATTTRVTTSVTNDTSQNAYTFTSGSTQTITNAGIWTLSSGGSLIQKSDHAGVPLLNGDSITYTFKIQIA